MPLVKPVTSLAAPATERPEAGAERSWLLYDGECPFCTQYVKLLRIREAVGPIDLIDARQSGPEYALARAKGFDIDAGMLLHHKGVFHHGDGALHMLAALSTPLGPFNRAMGWLFGSPARARMAYPWLRGGRNLVLRALGRKPLVQR